MGTSSIQQLVSTLKDLIRSKLILNYSRGVHWSYDCRGNIYLTSTTPNFLDLLSSIRFQVTGFLRNLLQQMYYVANVSSSVIDNASG